MKHIIGAFLFILAMAGLLMAMNANLSVFNLLGVFLFWLGSALGAFHFEGRLINGQFMIDIKNFWRRENG